MEKGPSAAGAAGPLYLIFDDLCLEKAQSAPNVPYHLMGMYSLLLSAFDP